MAAPAKTTDEAIVRAARRLVERGEGDFSMAAVAAAVGVQAPSLYKRFRDRSVLEAHVRRDAMGAIERVLAAAATQDDPIRAMAHAYVDFALRHPRLYALLFKPGIDEDEETDAARRASVVPVLAALREVTGERDALNAARLFTAYLHGYVSMVLAGAFKLGGDVEAALDYAIDRLAAAIAQR